MYPHVCNGLHCATCYPQIQTISASTDSPVGTALATSIASERVLSMDWDTPEEDEAWKDL